MNATTAEVAAEIERWKDRPTITRRSHTDQIQGIERLRDLLEALSSPPADDVREALYEILRFGNDGDEMDTVDRILKRFPVRTYGTGSDAEVEWEYRGVACEPETGDVYDSTRPFETETEAREAAIQWGLLESNPDLPQLVLGTERRRKAGGWGHLEAAREARS